MKATAMKNFQRLAALTTLGLASLAAQAASVVVDVTGAKSINLLPDTGNTVWFIDIGANAQLTSVEWTVTLNAFAPSSLSDMQVSFGRSDGADLINLSPDAFDGFSGTGSYSGSLDLTGWGVGASADGKLRIEFNERFKDLGLGVTEGQWVTGTLTFGVSAVPEPASAAMALLGLGLVAGARRIRRG